MRRSGWALAALVACAGPDADPPAAEAAPAGVPASIAELAPGDTLGLLGLMRREIDDGDAATATAVRRDTTMPTEGYREPRRLTLWTVSDVPVKLVATEPNDAGLMRGETIAWLRGGEVRVVQEPFTILAFDADRLVLWTDEAMVPVDVTDADRSTRERAVIDSVKARLRVFGLGYP